MQACIRIFGKDRLAAILPELIALLPDIVKQHEVYNAYCVVAEPVVRSVSAGKGGVQRAVAAAEMPSIKGFVGLDEIISLRKSY